MSKLETITSPKLYLDHKLEKIDEDGLISERIFGPTKSYRCKCGTLTSKKLYAKKRCEKCNVLCDTSNLRYNTFAKIKIPFPLLKPILKYQKELKKIIPKKEYHILDTKQSDLTLKETNYLKHNPNNDILKLTKTYDPTNCIPLVVSGMYTLYIALYVAAVYFNSAKADQIVNECFTYEVLVLPPAARYSIPLTKGNQRRLTKNDLNEYYSRLISISNFDWKYIQDPINIRDTYIKMVGNTIGSNVAIIDEELRKFDTDIARHQYYLNQIYDQVNQLISGKEGIIRRDFIGKTIDFSSRSHIVVNPILKAYEIRIPKATFITLWFVEFLRYLYKNKSIQLEKLTKFIKINENQVTREFGDHIDEFIDYYFNDPTVNEKEKIVLINRQPTLKQGVVKSCELLEHP
jgi:DNA-directed RNA polymerase subunit beta'